MQQVVGQLLLLGKQMLDQRFLVHGVKAVVHLQIKEPAEGKLLHQLKEPGNGNLDQGTIGHRKAVTIKILAKEIGEMAHKIIGADFVHHDAFPIIADRNHLDFSLQEIPYVFAFLICANDACVFLHGNHFIGCRMVFEERINRRFL